MGLKEIILGKDGEKYKARLITKIFLKKKEKELTSMKKFSPRYKGKKKKKKLSYNLEKKIYVVTWRPGKKDLHID